MRGAILWELRPVKSRVEEFRKDSMYTLPKIPNLNAFSGQVHFVKTMGRILLALTAVLLITMPATQHLWSWDHFLHGGHDYELGTLMLLSLISLALVLPKHCKQYVDSLFASWVRLRFFFCDAGLSKEAFCAFDSLCGGPANIDIRTFPLQI